MGGQRVFGVQSGGDLQGQIGRQATVFVNPRQSAQFFFGISLNLGAFAFGIGFFGIGLRRHRYIFPRRHRQGPRRKPCHACQHYA